MEEKSEKFIKTLAQRLSGHLIDDDQLQTIFDDAVSGLPEKSKMKKHLKTLSKSYIIKFCSFCEETRKNSLLPFKSTVNSSLVQEIRAHATNETKLMTLLDDAFDACDGSSAKVALSKKLRLFTVSCNVPLISHCVLYALYRYFEKEIEDFVQGKNSTSLSELKKIMISLVILLPSSNTAEEVQGAKSSELPSLDSLIIAIFSLLIDATLLESSSTDKTEAVGYKLIEIGLTFLGNEPGKILESLLQVSASKQPQSDIVLKPIYEYVFLRTNWFNKALSEPTFLKYILGIRQAVLLLETNHSAFTNDLSMAGVQVLAPEYFYEWALKQKGGADLLDITPLLATTKPADVTKYFMKECEMETLEDFLDLSMSGLTSEEEASEPIEDHGRTSATSPTDFAFVLDTKPSISDQKIMKDTSDIVANDDVEDNFNDDHAEEELLKQTEYLLGDDNTTDALSLSTFDQSTETTKIATSRDTIKIIPQKRIEDSDGSETSECTTTSSTKRKRKPVLRTPRQSKKSRAATQANSPILLSPITEDTVHTSKPSIRSRKPAPTRGKERSDSESSTGSHGYMTRSRKRSESSLASN